MPQSAAPTSGIPVHSVYEVFTPTSSSPVSEIRRPALAASIASALSIPGQQLLIYGQSGSGKSTALMRELGREGAPRFVTVRCSPDTSVNALVHSALIQFGIADHLDPAIALPRAAVELGKRGIMVVVEDAHRLAQVERDRLVTVMKVFSDLANRYPLLKVIAIAAIDEPSEFGRFDIEFSTRIAEVHVPSMSLHELATIVRAGGQLLNVSTDEVAREIAMRSGGMPAIAHALALESFVDARILRPRESQAALPVIALTHAIESRLLDIPSHIRDLFDAAFASGRIRMAVTGLLNALSMFDPAGARIPDVIEFVGRSNGVGSGEYLPDVIDHLAHDVGVLDLLPHERVRFSSGLLHSYWTLIAQSQDGTSVSEPGWVPSPSR